VLKMDESDIMWMDMSQPCGWKCFLSACRAWVEHERRRRRQGDDGAHACERFAHPQSKTLPRNRRKAVEELEEAVMECHLWSFFFLFLQQLLWRFVLRLRSSALFQLLCRNLLVFQSIIPPPHYAEKFLCTLDVHHLLH
jgi:hypothetical protein